MIVLEQLLLVLNLLVAVLFGMAYFVAENPKSAPKTKAKTGVLLATSFLAFLVLLAIFAILRVVLNCNALPLALLIFVIIPFVIGRLATYRTLKFYTIVQILTLLLSAATLCVHLIEFGCDDLRAGGRMGGVCERCSFEIRAENASRKNASVCAFSSWEEHS